MPDPSIDYTCPHCGANETYRLVPDVAPDPRASAAPHQVPSIDLSCSRCGGSQTYKIVPASAAGAR